MAAVNVEINVTWRWLEKAFGIFTDHHVILVSQENTLVYLYDCEISRSSVTLIVTSRE